MNKVYNFSPGPSKINASVLKQVKNSIENFDWSCIETHSNCNHAYQYFSNSLKKIFNESFPVQKVKKRYRNRLPGLTDGLKRAIKHKNKLYKKQIKYHTYIILLKFLPILFYKTTDQSYDIKH